MVTSVASAALLYVSSSLSIAGTSLVFLDHWRNPKVWARPARRLLTWLCVADFVTALAYLFPASDSSHACTAQATVGIYAPVASFMWTDCIALYVYWIVSSLKRRTWLLRSSRQVFWVFHAVCWTVPGIACLAVLLSGHAGKNENTETSGWCWIKTTADDDVADDDKAERRRRDEMFLWEVIGGKGVEWFSVLVWCPVLYYLCWSHLSRAEAVSRFYDDMDRSNHSASSNASGNGSESVDGDISASLDGAEGSAVSFTQFKRKLALVPVIFFLLRLPGNILTVWLFLEPTADTESGLAVFLSVAQVFCDPLQGFCNGVLFVACAQSHEPPSEVPDKAHGRLGDVPRSAGRRDRREDSVSDFWSRPSSYGQSTHESGDYQPMPGEVDERRTSATFRTQI